MSCVCVCTHDDTYMKLVMTSCHVMSCVLLRVAFHDMIFIHCAMPCMSMHNKNEYRRTDLPLSPSLCSQKFVDALPIHTVPLPVIVRVPAIMQANNAPISVEQRGARMTPVCPARVQKPPQGCAPMRLARRVNAAARQREG